MNQILENLMKQSMPEIDWKARYYVDLNNGEKLQHNQEWFGKFAELIAGECAVALAKVPGGVDSSIWYSNLQKFNKHLGIAK